MRERLVKLTPEELFEVVCNDNRGAEGYLMRGQTYIVNRVRENYATGERAYGLDTVKDLWFNYLHFSRTR